MRESLIDQAYRQARGGIPMTVMAVLGIAVIHWLRTHTLFFPWWVAAMLLLMAVRGTTLWWHRHYAGRLSVARREAMFIGPLVATAGLWGVLPVLGFPSADEVETLALICILSGMAGGASNILASLAWPARLYIVCILLPASLMVYDLPGTGPVLSMLALAFMVVMLVGHAQARRQLVRSLVSLLDNQALLSDLRRQRTELGRLNDQLLGTQRALLDNNSRLEQMVRERTERIRLAFAAIENTAGGVAVMTPDRVIVEVNPAFCQITGYPATEVLGRHSSLLRSGRQSEAFYEALWQQLYDSGRWDGQLWSRRRDGSEFLQRRTMDAVRDRNGAVTHFVSVFHDITESYEKDQRLRHQALHDPLTGLANRSLLARALDSGITSATAQARRLGLLFFDLDQFKAVNDSLGHLSGDAILKMVGERLSRCLAPSDTLARVGGDEFVVLMQDVDDAADCGRMAQRLLDVFIEPFELPEARIFVRSSLGIAIFPDDGDNATDLLKNADMALYAAKAAGRNTFTYFDASLAERARQRLDTELALRLAIERDELSLHYQPKVDADSGQVLGFEALLRWHKGHTEWVPPDRFIPVAEDAGLIGQLGAWVVAEVCRQIAEWARQGLGWWPVAVNASARQLHTDDLPALIRTECERHRVASSLIEVEVTESFIMSDPTRSAEVLSALREMGVRIAIDDFGTGYSSLSYLRSLPADILKIDRSFVRESVDDPAVRAIVTSIVTLGRTLGLSVVAEGVETTRQAELLREIGCEILQGYLFAPPRPAAQIEISSGAVTGMAATLA